MTFVNFHSAELILPRAERLRQEGFQVIVANNGGAPPAGLRVVPCPGNIGFGAACNLAVKALDSSVEVVCLHNPDVDIDPADIHRLARSLTDQARPGAVAPAERTGRLLRQRGYHYPKVWREAALGLRPLRRAHAARARKQGQPQAADRRPAPPRLLIPMHGTGRRYAAAALLLVARAAWEDLGGFDEHYFMYYEDLDLWHRLGQSGYDCEFLTDIVAFHHYAAGSPTDVSRRELYRWLSVELFCEKFETAPWRAMRWVHRALLRRHRVDSPQLAGAMLAGWRAGHLPSEALRRLLPSLETGEPASG